MLLLSAVTQATCVAGLGEVLEERLGGVEVLAGPCCSANPSIGASSAFSASNSVPKSGYGKKSRSSRSAWPASWNCCDVNIPWKYIAGPFWTSVCGRVLPDPAGGTLLVEGQDLLERVEDGLDLGSSVHFSLPAISPTWKS